MPDLKAVVLQGPGITDAGLVHLETLTGLETLSIRNTRVTSQGIEQLQSALPDCTISRTPGPE